MNRATFFILLTAILLLCAGCGSDRHINNALDRADSLMETAPDSALTILLDVDSAAATCGRDFRARHALLLSFTRYKLYIEAPDADSLIAVAAEYFSEKSGHSHEKLLALFMLADSQRNAGEYARSIITATKAEKEALALGDFKNLGRTYRLMSLNFNSVFDRNAELDYARKSVEAFMHQDDHIYTRYAYYLYGVALYNNRDYATSREVADSVARGALADGDMEMYANGLHISGVSACRLEDYDATIETLEKLIALEGYQPVSSDIECLGGAYIKKGNVARAKELGRHYSHLGKNIFYLDYSISLEEKDYKQALESQLRRYQYNDSLFRAMSQQNLAAMLSDNFALERSLMEEEHLRHKIWYGIAIAALVLTLLAVGGLALLWRRKQLRQRRESLLMIEDLSQKLSDNEEMIVAMKESISGMFGESFSMIDHLLESYYTMNTLDKKQGKIIDEFTQLMRGLKGEGELLKQLEEAADKYKNGIMSDFHHDFPELTREDNLLFLFCLMNLSPGSMCLLLDADKKSLYNRRYRMRNRIIHMEPMRRDEYLDILKVC